MASDRKGLWVLIFIVLLVGVIVAAWLLHSEPPAYPD